MKRSLIIPVIGVLALAAGTAYARWNGGGAPPRQNTSAVPSESIDVHGDWKVAIYNADGSLDREYAFSNALLSNAGEALGIALSPAPPTNNRRINWILAFGDLTEPRQSPCAIGIGDPINGSNWPSGSVDLCFLDSRFGTPPDLSVESIDDGLRLSGSVEAAKSGTIDYVESWMVMSRDDGTTSTFGFTGTEVGPFEDVQDGQIIQIEVEITFSTPAP